MNSRNLKSIKKTELTLKTFIVWGVILITLVLMIVFGVQACNRRKSIKSYASVEMVSGQQIFNQEEANYMVLVYGFNGEKEFETFDNTVFKYLEYQRNNSKKEGVLKVYGADIDEYSNKVCLTTGDSNINNTTKYAGNSLESDTSAILRINDKQIPVLLIINDGTVTKYQAGESSILDYLQSLEK